MYVHTYFVCMVVFLLSVFTLHYRSRNIAHKQQQQQQQQQQHYPAIVVQASTEQKTEM